jgi:hypothetical protein
MSAKTAHIWIVVSMMNMVRWIPFARAGLPGLVGHPLAGRAGGTITPQYPSPTRKPSTGRESSEVVRAGRDR